MVILVSGDAAQLNSLSIFCGNGSLEWKCPPFHRNFNINIEEYFQIHPVVRGQCSPWLLLSSLKINLSFTDFIWFILEITFSSDALSVILKHSHLDVSLASSLYFSTNPNCSNRNACKIAASAFQRHASAVVSWLTWQHAQRSDPDCGERLCESIILHKAGFDPHGAASGQKTPSGADSSCL